MRLKGGLTTSCLESGPHSNISERWAFLRGCLLALGWDTKDQQREYGKGPKTTIQESEKARFHNSTGEKMEGNSSRWPDVWGGFNPQRPPSPKTNTSRLPPARTRPMRKIEREQKDGEQQ
jgi:hypothetical protein